jgi:hypothetical protein
MVFQAVTVSPFGLFHVSEAATLDDDDEDGDSFDSNEESSFNNSSRDGDEIGSPVIGLLERIVRQPSRRDSQCVPQ